MREKERDTGRPSSTLILPFTYLYYVHIRDRRMGEEKKR